MSFVIITVYCTFATPMLLYFCKSFDHNGDTYFAFCSFKLHILAAAFIWN